jgi:hypothetical protein
MERITIYKGLKYSLDFKDDTVNLYSLNPEDYPNIINLLIKSDLMNAYKKRVWVKIRGCEALYNGIIDGAVLLDVRPSSDVNILEAKEVDRGVFHAKLPIAEIENMWEERMPYLDYPFPENMPTKVEIEIPK